MEGCWTVRIKERTLASPEGAVVRLGSEPLFSLMAYLAYRRLMDPPGGGWIHVCEIQHMPGWRGHSTDSIGKEVQRYIKGGNSYPIAYEKVSRGPYRFDADPSRIAFDVEIPAIESLLGILQATGPSIEEMEAPTLPSVLSFVAALASMEGTRDMGWSRPEYLACRSSLEAACQSPEVPTVLRFLGLDRVLGMFLYSSHSNEFEQALSRAEALSHQKSTPERLEWMQTRIATHRVRLLLRQGDCVEAARAAAQTSHLRGRQRADTDSRTTADLYNSEGLARTRLSQGDVDEARKGLGLLYRALEMRLLALQFDEVHDSCVNLGTVLANDLGDVKFGLRWMGVADIVRDSCGVGAYSGIPDFTVVSMVRRFPSSDPPLTSRKAADFLQEIGMTKDARVTIEQFVEERLDMGFKRSNDFDDRQGLMVGYRTRAYIRWLQGRSKEAFADALRYVHTARSLGHEPERQPVPHVEPLKGPLGKLYDFAWGLRLKGKSVEDVPAEKLADYLEEYDEQVREILAGD